MTRPARPSVVFVHQGSEFGGGEAVFETVAEGLLERGIASAHFVPQPGQAADYLGGKVDELDVYPRMHRSREARHLLAAGRRLRTYAKARHADVVIAAAVRGHVYAALATAGTRTKVVQVFHDPVEQPDALAALATVLRKPDATVFTSARAHDESTARMQRRRGARIIQASINTRKIEAGLRAAGVAGNVGEKAFVKIARIQEHKGYEHVLRAFAHVVAGDSSARLFCVGSASPLTSPAYVDRVHSIVADAGIERNVTFTGFLPDDELYPLLARSLSLVHAAEHESLGLVLLEAMYLGKPVVATRAEGPERVVVDGETGYLVPVGDATALAARMTDLLVDHDQARSFGLAARRRFESQFNPDHMVAGYEDLVRGLLR
jgi:glycosyltransferase involved in cell wall biosynthesis